MEYANITVETRENLGIITLNRPQALNAVNAEMLKELALAAEAFDNNDAVRVLIVKGDGKTFAAGIDIKEVLSRADSKFLGIDEMQNCFRRFAAIKKPIIAAVSGYAWESAANWRWPATLFWLRTTQGSASRNSVWAQFRHSAPHSV